MEIMKYRDVMKKDGGNLGWCIPVKLSYKGKEAIITQNEGEIAGLCISGKDIIKNQFDTLIKHLGIDDANNLSDLYNYLWDGEKVITTEMACRQCTWFKTCCAMNENI
jgi:hypothetical protein